MPVCCGRPRGYLITHTMTPECTAGGSAIICRMIMSIECFAHPFYPTPMRQGVQQIEHLLS